MKGLIRYFIKYPIAGNVLMVGMLLAGVASYLSISSNFFPTRPDRLIKVQIIYPGASPEEVEEGVIVKIEDNLKGLTGIDEIRSVSSENAGNIDIEITEGSDIDVVLADVKNAVDRVNSYPGGMEQPVVYKIENLDFAIGLALSGELELSALKRYARKAENDLRAVEGISKIELSGFPDEEIEISLSEERMRAYQLTFEQVANAVRSKNLEVTGGTIKGPEREMLIRARNKQYYANEMYNIELRTRPDGTKVYLKDVADIRDQFADEPVGASLNGSNAVIINVSSTSAEDFLFITEYVRNYAEAFNKSHDSVKATVTQDQSITLRDRIDLLVNNGIIGFLLVTLLLAMFLNIRLAFWVAMAIPVSFAGMFVMATGTDLTINVISLFGMILVIGILVDDGIVIAENIYQRWERGEDRWKAAVNGTLEVLPAVFSAILTTVIAFSAFFFIEGTLGDFFREMAFVVIATLAVSLVEGILILPGHVAHSDALKRTSDKKTAWRSFFDGIMFWMRDKLYAPVLRFMLHNKAIAVAIPWALLFITFGAIGGGIIRTTFFPNIDRDDLTVTVKMPSGTAEHITRGWIEHIEEATWQINDSMRDTRADSLDVIQNVVVKYGPGTQEGVVRIYLLDGETRQVNSLVIAGAIRERAGEIIGAESVSFAAASPFGKPISVRLISEDLSELEGAVEELSVKLRSMEALKDVVDDNQEGLEEIDIRLKDKAWMLGLSLQQVIGQVRQGFFGTEVQRLQRGIDEVKVWVRYKEEDRSSIAQLENMYIRTPDGGEYPLSEIADLNLQRGVLSINHFNGRRAVKVEADVADPNESISDLNSQIRDVIMPEILSRYPSVSFDQAGQNEEAEKSQKSIGTIMPLIFGLMFITVVFTFRSISQALVVFSLIPLCLIGVAWGHWFVGLIKGTIMPMSLFSFLGIIALIGILLNDALVLVASFNKRLSDGDSLYDAIFEAGLSRFRPIVLTSITTIAGLAPLIANKSFQAQFLIPMAVAVAFGLLFVTTVILLTLPVYLVILNKFKRGLFGLVAWKKFDELELEPAIRELESEKHSDEI